MSYLAAAQGTQCQVFQQESQDRPAQHGTDESYEYIGSGSRYQHQADKGTEHEDFAMGHIDDVQHPENQRIANGNDSIGTAKIQPINKLLKKHDIYPSICKTKERLL